MRTYTTIPAVPTPTPVHFRYLFSPDEEFLVLHPLSPAAALHEVATMPVYTIERFGPATGVRKSNKSLLFTYLREKGFSICRNCHRAQYCSVLTWNDAWITKTSLSFVPAFVLPEKPSQFKEMFDDLFVRITAKRAAVSLSEVILDLRSPYTKADVVRAYRQAVLVHHPDHGGSNEAFNRVVKAKDELLSRLP